MDFYRMRLEAGYPSRDDVAKLCGVTTQTIRNWEQKQPPAAVVALFQILAHQLDWVSTDWSGWRFKDGFLITLENRYVTPGDIRAIPYLKQTIRFIRKRDDL